MQEVSVIGTEIPNNESRSGEVDLGNHTLAAIEIPATWAGTAITFQSKSTSRPALGDNSNDDLETWKDVYDSGGTELSVTVAANRIVVPTAAVAAALAPLRYIRVRSGTAAAPVNQSPSKPIKLIVK